MSTTPGPGAGRPAGGRPDVGPPDDGSPDSRRARLAERRARGTAFRRYLKLTVLGALLPGSAFIASGRRVLGAVVLTVAAALVIAAVGVLLVVGPKDLGVELAVRPEATRWVGIGLIVAAALWVLVMIASQRSLEPRQLSLGQRLIGSGLVVVLCSVVAAPLAVGSQLAFTTQDLVRSVFPDIQLDDAGRDPGSITVPTIKDVEDPWPDKARINVLLLGSDSSQARVGLGVRTDTMIVASIDKATGQTVLLSLPRNLQRAPFPEGKFRRAYPDGFTNPANPDLYLLNALYNTVPLEHPELFPKGTRRPGVDSLKLAIGETLGLDIDYYVMVNLGGFRRVIDALGGIVLDVRFPVPINSSATAGGSCTKPEGYVEAGENRLLDGNEALWFSRARCGGGEMVDGDNDRMRRQRCVIGAIVDRASPQQLLMRYQALAAEAKRVVSTDIPQSLLSAFVGLGERVSEHEVRSLAFTGTTLRGTNANPDFGEIRRLVRKALRGPAASKPSARATATAKSSASGTSSPGTSSPGPTPTATKGEESGTAQSLSAVC